MSECGQIVALLSRAVRTESQVLTLKARLLQASRAVHLRLLSAAGAKGQSAWACRTDRQVRTGELASNPDAEPWRIGYIYTGGGVKGESKKYAVL